MMSFQERRDEKPVISQKMTSFALNSLEICDYVSYNVFNQFSKKSASYHFSNLRYSRLHFSQKCIESIGKFVPTSEKIPIISDQGVQMA